LVLCPMASETVRNDFGLHSCWMRALAKPWLFKRAFTEVRESRECCDPKVRVFSLLEKL
jgi:hypothetical protein